MIGNKIKEIRKSKKLSQAELGNLIGVAAASIMRYEKGQREPNKETIEKLAMALNISPSELLGWDVYEENIRNENGFVTYLKSMGYSYSTGIVKVLESHVEDMVDDNGNIIGQDTIIDDAEYSITLSKDNITSKFTEDEFQELQKKSKESIEGAILLQNLKNREELKSAATDDNSK